MCPVLCSGHGRYQRGSCSCNEGWKGDECEVRANECQVSDCSGRGQCHAGKCHCLPGYKGDHCEIGKKETFLQLKLSLAE